MAQLEQNGIVWSREVNRETGVVTFKRLRRIYTDTIDQNGAVLDDPEFVRIIKRAMAHPGNEAVDGLDVKSWGERPDA